MRSIKSDFYVFILNVLDLFAVLPHSATSRRSGGGAENGSNDDSSRWAVAMHWGGCRLPMPYEPGSPECRVLIDCKLQIEAMLLALDRIENSRHIHDQLVSVHHQLEGLHELHRRQPRDPLTA